MSSLKNVCPQNLNQSETFTSTKMIQLLCENMGSQVAEGPFTFPSFTPRDCMRADYLGSSMNEWLLPSNGHS